MKQAIAILDATGDNGSVVAKFLAKDYRLLLFGHDRHQLNKLATQVRKIVPQADLDCLGCAFEASWEADVIILDTIDEKAMAEKIRQVATQKLVIELTTGANTIDLKALLPDSKVRLVASTNETQMLQNIRTILSTTV